jgi:hypothetical protein
MTGHDVKTVPEAGWAGIKNGSLLKTAERDFDAFITVDRNLSFQQDLKQLRIAVIVLAAKSNRFQALLPLVPRILDALKKIQRGELAVVSA